MEHKSQNREAQSIGKPEILTRFDPAIVREYPRIIASIWRKPDDTNQLSTFTGGWRSDSYSPLATGQKTLDTGHSADSLLSNSR